MMHTDVRVAAPSAFPPEPLPEGVFFGCDWIHSHGPYTDVVYRWQGICEPPTYRRKVRMTDAAVRLLQDACLEPGVRYYDYEETPPLAEELCHGLGLLEWGYEPGPGQYGSVIYHASDLGQQLAAALADHERHAHEWLAADIAPFFVDSQQYCKCETCRAWRGDWEVRHDADC